MFDDINIHHIVGSNTTLVDLFLRIYSDMFRLLVAIFRLNIKECIRWCNIYTRVYIYIYIHKRVLCIVIYIYIYTLMFSLKILIYIYVIYTYIYIHIYRAYSAL